MENQIPRLLAFLVGFAVGTAASFTVVPFGPRHAPNLVGQHFERRVPNRSKEILAVLMPDGVWADDSKLELLSETNWYGC